MKNLIISAVSLIGLATIPSCKKVDTPTPLGEGGATIVRIVNGGKEGADVGYKLTQVELSSEPQTRATIEVRRDVANNTDLNKTMVVLLKSNPTVISGYDNALLPLPENAYTVEAPNTKTGDTYTVTFLPGEFSKFINITIPDVSGFDLSNRYALGFTLTSADAGGTVSGNDISFVIEIGVKNKWDGDYHSELGYFYHPTVPRAIPNGAAKTCVTSGVNSVLTELGDFNGIVQPAVYLVKLTIDASNQVTISPSGGAAPSPNPVGTLTSLPTSSPGYTAFPGSTPSRYNNTWDPATNTFYLRYGYTNAAGAWRAVEEVLVKN